MAGAHRAEKVSKIPSIEASVIHLRTKVLKKRVTQSDMHYTKKKKKNPTNQSTTVQRH